MDDLTRVHLAVLRTTSDLHTLARDMNAKGLRSAESDLIVHAQVLDIFASHLLHLMKNDGSVAKSPFKDPTQ